MEKHVLTDEVLTQRIEQNLAYRLTLQGTINEQIPLELVSCSAREKVVEFRLPVTSYMQNTKGAMHGGMIATVFDMAMGILCKAYTDADSAPTISLQISYIRPVQIGTALHIFTKMTGAGRTLLNVTAEAWTEDAADKISATASGSFFKVKSSVHPINYPAS